MCQYLTCRAAEAGPFGCAAGGVTSGSTPVVEDHLDVSFASCRAGGCDGLPVLCESEAWANHGIEVYLWRDPHREPEALYALAAVVLDAEMRGTGEVYLFVPEG